MARKPPDDYCMLCDASPCACNKKTAKRTRPPTPRLAPPAVEQPSRTASTLTGFRPPKVEQSARPAATMLNTTPLRDEDDPALRRAVTIIAESGLLDGPEMAKHRKLIDLTDDQIIQIRASEWTKRKERRDHPVE